MRPTSFSALIIVLPLFSAPPPPKLCALLSMPEVEAHFGAKVTATRGNKQVRSRYAPAAGTMTVELRLGALKKMLERDGAQAKNFGSVGCFNQKVDMGTSKLPATTCFLEKDGYMSLSLKSDDATKLGFDDVKALLEKAAARRK